MSETARRQLMTPASEYVDRFWARVQKQPGDGCWLWTGKPAATGYGQLRIVGVAEYAHRVSWRVNYGEIPAARHVLHRCDVPLCVRPDHLFLGDQADNNRDMCAKGRHGFQTHPEKSTLTRWVAAHPRRLTRGESHPNAKLTAAVVVEIREAYAAGEPQWKIARRFGVVQITVSRIVRGLLWADVGGPRTEARR